MGEEEKKAEEPKTEPKKQDSAPAEEKKKEKGGEAKEVPPTEVVLKVFMHCEGCARKVRRCLRGFDGVEDVMTDCKSSKVVVKGEKAAADPLKVLDRVQRKSRRQVQLISPIPKPPEEDKEKPKEEDKPKPKPEEKKEEEPKVIVVVLKVHMHCEACAQEIKKRIQRMKGVESAEPNLKKSEVVVKGVFEPAKLVEYVYKRTGKHAAIVKQEPELEKKDEKPKEEKKGGDGGEKKGEKEEESKEKEGEAKTEQGKEETEETKVVEMKRNEFQYYPPRYGMELYAYPPPPQMFSDENPNACSVM